jgi:hypothetical protein
MICNLLHIHYPNKSIRTPTRNCNPTFPVIKSTSQSWTLITGGSALCLFDSSNSARKTLYRCLNVSGGMAAHSSCRDVARAVSDVGCWGLERSRRSNLPHGCSMGFILGLGLASPFLEPYCPQTITSHALFYGREHCHADTDNRHHRTGLLS